PTSASPSSWTATRASTPCCRSRCWRDDGGRGPLRRAGRRAAARSPLALDGETALAPLGEATLQDLDVVVPPLLEEPLRLAHVDEDVGVEHDAPGPRDLAGPPFQLVERHRACAR